MTELLAALDAAEPEAGLDAALAVLRSRGWAAAPELHAPWLELEYGSRRLMLAADGGSPELDPATLALIRQLLAAKLAHLAERDALRALRERYEMLSEASSEGILIHEGGVPVEVNQRMREMFGYSRDEILGPETMTQCVAPEDFERALARIRDRVEGEFLVTLVRKNGSRFPAEFCTKQTRLGDRPLRVVAMRDVTQRERAAQLLRESETRLRQILEATFDGVVLSRNGVIVDVGGNIERFFGRPRAEIIGRPILEFAAPSSREDVQQRIQDQTVGSYETTVIGAGGELIPSEIVSVMSTLEGEPVRVAGLRDLRAPRRLEQERRHLEMQAERSQRLQSLGVLAGGIAHDFNNLLVGVLGGAELLESQLADPEQHATAQMIRVAGERASGLTKQLLAYAGRRDVGATETLDLSALLLELRGLLGAALSKKALLELELEPNSTVLGERATLSQVLMNLLVNASDALEDRPGTIHVSTRHVREPDARWDEALGANVKPGAWVQVQVRDSGVGMDQATQRRIFEPFYTTKTSGHGLGLGTCLGIVAAHGGAIHVRSAPGQGSTFSVLLPASHGEANASDRTTGMRARPCRVLIVDDEPLVRQHLRRLLELRGFSVTEAADGRSGIAAVSKSEPDLILLDLSMPDLDGVTVVRNLRAAGSRVRVVLCSGNLDYAAERGLESGIVQGLLQKPFSTEELIEAIERARS
jgi:two-component system, cell cycle sensor histidine kinase and response regulator CckA